MNKHRIFIAALFTEGDCQSTRGFHHWELVFNGHRISGWDDGKVLERIVVMAAQHHECA